MSQPPSRGLCLWMARVYWEARPQTEWNRQRSWDWLLCWGFYDMYLEGWSDD